VYLFGYVPKTEKDFSLKLGNSFVFLGKCESETQSNNNVPRRIHVCSGVEGDEPASNNHETSKDGLSGGITTPISGKNLIGHSLLFQPPMLFQILFKVGVCHKSSKFFCTNFR
jgi:hypothetical protein